MQSLYAKSIFDGDSFHTSAWLNIENNIVVSVSDEPLYSQQNRYKGILTPGFIDLQVNGGGGILFNNMPTLSSINAIIQAHRQFGTHELLITLITSSDQTLFKALDAVEKGISRKTRGLRGIHLEGPMINPIKRGIHPEKNIHLLNDKILADLQSRNLGKILITLAPELVSYSLIQELKEANITIFAGHSNVTAIEIKDSMPYGITGFTHLYNAMPPALSRNPSMLGFALTDQQSWGTLINDSIHVDPLMVKLAINSKTPEKIILITDAMATLGSDIQSFEFEGEIIYRDNDRLINHEGKLAGAHIDLFSAVNNTLKLGYNLEQVLPMVTKNPAKALNIFPEYGSLKKGAIANINLIKNDMITCIT